MPSYLRENEAKNLQNGDVHLVQIPDFGMGIGISQETSGALKSVMAHLLAFFNLIHLSLTYFSTGVFL